MFYASTTKKCLPRKCVCLWLSLSHHILIWVALHTYRTCSYVEFPKREFPRSGIVGIPIGIPGSKTALFWEFPGIPWNFLGFPYRGGSSAYKGGCFGCISYHFPCFGSSFAAVVAGDTAIRASPAFEERINEATAREFSILTAIANNSNSRKLSLLINRWRCLLKSSGCEGSRIQSGKWDRRHRGCSAHSIGNSAEILRNIYYLITDMRSSTFTFPPQPWIPGIPSDSFGFPGISGYSGNSQGSFLEVGIPGTEGEQL